MTCKKTTGASLETVRKVLAGLEPKRAAQHKLALCCRATECGRLCDWFYKRIGKRQVWCKHPDRSAIEQVICLYDLLDKPEAQCPGGHF